MSWDIVVNPVSGTGAAPKFVEQHVVPLLSSLGLEYKIHTTTAVRDASRIGKEIKGSGSSPHNVVIAAGDGTAHEMTEGIIGDAFGKWRLAVLPMGTANALHSTLFPPKGTPVPVPDSLQRYIANDEEVRHALSSLILALSDAEPRPLPITLTKLRNSSGVTEVIPSHIVLSTCLHASILADSEALRETVPGVDRFKMAALQNLETFFYAEVELLGEEIKQWDPVSSSWSEPFTHDSFKPPQKGTLSLDGPFAYFLSATTTPRLEPTFVINPTLSAPGVGTMDIVILRSMRDPRTSLAEDMGKAWSRRAMEVFNAAYRDGAHIRLLYDGHEGEQSAQDVASVENPDRQNVVVEVFRCSGFRWVPQDDNPKTHIVCADGSLHSIAPEGSAEAAVMDAGEDGFWVWG